MTRPTTPRRKSTDRKRDLAEAALRCLQQGGYAGLTARKIAAEAGMSLGHISYHFPNMDALLAAAYRLASERLRHKSQDLLEGRATPLERLEAFLQAGFTEEFLTPAHLRMRIDLWSAALGHPAIAETELALYQRYRQELDRHLAALAAPDKAGNIPLVSDLIMAALDGLWLDWMRRRDQDAVRNGLAGCLSFARAQLT